MNTHRHVLAFATQVGDHFCGRGWLDKRLDQLEHQAFKIGLVQPHCLDGNGGWKFYQGRFPVEAGRGHLLKVTQNRMLHTSEDAAFFHFLQGQKRHFSYDLIVGREHRTTKLLTNSRWRLDVGTQFNLAV